MNTCLITKLNTVIDNKELPVFGQMKFIIPCRSIPTQSVLSQGGIICDNATITVSDGYVCDSDGNLIGDGHNFSNKLLSNYRFVSDNDSYVTVTVKDNYSLNVVGFQEAGKIKVVSMKDVICRADKLTKFVFYLTSLENATKEDILLLLKK